uniref:Wsv332-like protein n=1 Tax=Metapenaeus ensis majanivirus TaxID=2984279 RepID=A0A9C7BZK1_9VIRU|nr:MAG: wsv332-like protein [Metapenaeus ensis majanivirus]
MNTSSNNNSSSSSSSSSSNNGGSGGLFTEGGLCLINVESIDQRHKRIKNNSKENEIINKESNNFLSSLITLCHGEESLKMLPCFEQLGKTLIDGVVKNSSQMTYEENSASNSNSNSNDNNIINQQDMNENDLNIIQDISIDVIKSAFFSSGDIKDKMIKPIIKLLAGYNPFRLKENLYFISCDNDSCPCNSVFKSTSSLSSPSSSSLGMDYNNPMAVLSMALRLFCHKNIDDQVQIQELEKKNNNIAIVPLKHILLSLIDYSSNFHTQIKIVDFASTEIESFHQSQWQSLLKNKIGNISFEYRGFILLTYCALLFFPFCRNAQTFKLINLYIETILFKICYNAAEVLFCASTNSTREKDNGKFINYVNSYTVSNILSSPIRIEKAIDQVYNNQDLKQITNILTCITGINDEMNNATCRDKILTEMIRLYSPSGFLKSNHKSEMRNVRNVELFKILGEIQMIDKTSFQVVIGKDLVNRYSKGNNIRANHFHILSMLPRANNLSSDSQAQSYIDNYLEQDDKQTQCVNLRNFAGWWMGIIDGIINEKGNELMMGNKNISMRTILSDTIRQVFKNRYISPFLLSHSFLPPQKTLTNNGRDMFDDKKNKVEVQESQKLCVFSSWQIPNIIGANCSILAPIQIEMALTHPQVWNNFISKIMFFIERFNMDCYRGVFDKIFEPEHNKSSKFLENIPQLINGNFTAHNDYTKQMSIIFKQVFDTTKQQYIEGANTESLVTTNKISKYTNSEKRLYSFDKIYDILRDIIINNNQNPQVYLQYSHQLLTLFSEIDDFLINALKIKGVITNSNNAAFNNSSNNNDNNNNSSFGSARKRQKKCNDKPMKKKDDEPEPMDI